MVYLDETEDNINMDLKYRLLGYDLIYNVGIRGESV
jgi:hypothetical protein